MHLAGAQGHRPGVGLHQQGPCVVHAGRGSAASVPSHRLAEQGISRPPRLQDMTWGCRPADCRAGRGAPRRTASTGGTCPGAASASEVAVSASSGGNSAVDTFSPMPSTAQPSWGRPSTRIPASLRPSIHTSLGHLISQRTGASSSTASQTATAAASGSSASCASSSRTTSDMSTALPAGAVHERPWRPRPALCSEAVTSVPCGAPAAARSLARALVESVSRAWARGRPSGLTAASAAPRSPAAAPEWRPRRRD